MTQNQELRDSLARKPGQVLEVLADEYQTSLETVIQSLPAEMWQKTEGTRILDILQTIATWEHPVTTIIHTPASSPKSAAACPADGSRAATTTSTKTRTAAASTATCATNTAPPSTASNVPSWAPPPPRSTSSTTAAAASAKSLPPATKIANCARNKSPPCAPLSPEHRL